MAMWLQIRSWPLLHDSDLVGLMAGGLVDKLRRHRATLILSLGQAPVCRTGDFFMSKTYFILLVLLVVGCASVETPSAPPAGKSHNIEVTQNFPSELPKGSSRFEDTQLFFVHADQASEFAASLLVPIPFVTGAIVDSTKDKAAQQLEKEYRSVSVFDITLDELGHHGTLKAGSGGYRLYPMLFIEECYDDLYRLSLAYQVESSDWFGRYYFHLPFAMPRNDIGAPSPAELESIGNQLHAGAQKLLDIIAADVSGDLIASGQQATVGSLYIVGSKIGGIASPMLLKYRHADILQETDSSLLVRLPGDPGADAKAGGMAYGVHYFEKDQLHTFEKQ